MLLRLRNWVVVIGLVLATGGHWAALQSVAWLGMTIQYSRYDTFATALRKTFDGKNPCSLCKVVQEGRDTEQKQAVVSSQGKLDLFLSSINWCVQPPVFKDELSPRFSLGCRRSESPPTPPPRLA
jgi:hypothetical protein